MHFTRLIARRYLWSKHPEAFITIITYISIAGVAIGVMVLTTVMAVMTGFQHTLREKILSTNSHIVVNKVGGKIFEWRELADRIRTIPEVESVAPFTYHQALLSNQGGNVGLLVRGIERGGSASQQLDDYMHRAGSGSVDTLWDPVAVEVVDGDGTVHEARLPGIVIGRELQRSLGVLVGSPVSLLSPSVSSSPFGLVPRFRRFVVVGTYSSGLVEYENGLGYMALEEAQSFFRMGDSVSGFEVRVRDIERASALTPQVLGAIGGASQGFYARDWTESNRPLWEAIALEKRAYFVVLLLIIVMASFSIISTLIMIVLEKRRDIAVLKTIGASPRAVATMFVLQGTTIGAVGTVLGLLLGVVACWALRAYQFPLDERIFPMSSLPVRMEPLNFALVGVAAFVICMCATIYPSRRAARLEPSELLRHT